MKEVAMSAEVWAIISAVIVILIAIATANRGMRREMHELRREMHERFEEVHKRIDGMGERVTDLRTEMIERFGQLSERLARVESFLEGMGYAQWKRASKERRDGEH